VSSTTRLQPLGQQDLLWSLSFLGAHAVPGVETWDGQTYSRALRTGQGTAHPDVVRLTVDGPHLLLDGPADAAPAVRALLGLDDDSAEAEVALVADPLLGPLVRRRPGLRVPGSPDHFETVVRTVVGQQVSVAAAATVVGRLVREHGVPVPASHGGPTHAFPTPAFLAALDPETLPMPRARGRSLVALARAVDQDRTVLDDDDAMLDLPGIGPWTVAYVRMRVHRDQDTFLPTDLGVRRQLTRMMAPGTGGVPTLAQVLQLANRWAPYRTTALLHLWAEYLAVGAGGSVRRVSEVIPADDGGKTRG